MYNGRAKTVMGCVCQRVACSREIAGGSAAICDSRAKVSVGCVMRVRRRKFAYRYVMISIGCSVDHYGFLLKVSEFSLAFYVVRELKYSAVAPKSQIDYILD